MRRIKAFETRREAKFLMGGAPHSGRAASGICWVMQWMLPPPSSTSRVATPITFRVGNSR